MHRHPAATTVTLDLEGRIASWPDAARDMFGRSEQEIIGRPLMMLVDPRQRDACANVVAHVCREAAADVVHSMELVAERSDGATFHVECSLWRSAGPAGEAPQLHALLRDIGDRVRIEQDLRQELRDLREFSAGQLQQLRRTQALFDNIAETIDEVFWAADPAITRMLYVSPGYERIWGRSCQSLYDDPRSFMDSIHPADRDRVLQNLIVQRSSRPFDHEYRIVRPDGTIVWIWDRGFPVRNADGTVDRYIGVAQDISARKLAEATVVRQQTIEAIGHMSGGLAHDFNNVLGVIIGHLDLVAMGTTPGSEARENIDLALDAALRGSRLARRLLALARREPLERRVIELGDTIQALLPLLHNAAGPQTRLVHQIAARPLVSVDPGELDGALINMAVNARSAMPEGGVLTIAVDEIELGAGADDYSVPAGRYARLTVSDTGCGMDEQVLRRLGEPFFSTRRAAEGTGLGVAMIHAFVRQSGGVLRVESAPGAGTTFTILLPALESSPGSADRRQAHGTMRT
jgi:PAS domain S-box-containing protein